MAILLPIFSDVVMPGGLTGYTRGKRCLAAELLTSGYDAELAGTKVACMWLMSVNVKISSLTYNYSVSIYGDTSSLGRSQ